MAAFVCDRAVLARTSVRTADRMNVQATDRR